MKVALVYDRVNKWGGAERVLLALHDMFPDAPLYTSVYNPQTAPWANVFTVKSSFLQRIPLAPRLHELFAAFMPVAFEGFTFDEYDVVISVTSEAAKGVITKPHTLHICYCLTPTRYLWSGHEEYFTWGITRFLVRPIIAYLRLWDRLSSQRPDKIIGISHEVSERIKKYYKRDALVIYPPLTLQQQNKKIIKQQDTEEYFLIVSRLVKYKRIDLAIKACNQLGKKLVIIGSGHEEAYLRSIAGETIHFLGNLTDEEIIEYYRGCSAFLFPGREDFGLTVIEAQSFGKPVIAYKAGATLETIIEGKTGEFFFPQTTGSLRKKLEIFDKKRYNAKSCIAQANNFRKEVFMKQIQSLVTNI